MSAVRCLACGDEMVQVDPMQVHPGCEVNPDLIATDLFITIKDAILNQPRSLQVRIGPSEIGHPCDRRLAFKLLRVAEVNNRGVAWKPFVGTCIHSELAQIMANAEIARWQDGVLVEGTMHARFHVEERVTVGQVGEDDVDGNTDLFDAATGIVWDWKFTTMNQIKRNYKPKGPGPQYRKQAHLYGRGWKERGFQVRHVGVIFMTRDGEFSDRYVWHEKFDEQVAIDALKRVWGIRSVLDILGTAGIPTFPAVDAYCQHCPWFKVGASDLAAACPGAPDSYDARRHDPSEPAFGAL